MTITHDWDKHTCHLSANTRFSSYNIISQVCNVFSWQHWSPDSFSGLQVAATVQGTLVVEAPIPFLHDLTIIDAS